MSVHDPQEISSFESLLHLSESQEVLKALKTQQASSGSGDYANSSFTGNTFVALSFKALSNSMMLNSKS